MESKINVIKADYADAGRPGQEPRRRSSSCLTAREVAKKAQLAERKALLSERVRSAYDTDRTSLLESFLSGGTFTDLLAEMSYFIDVGEQDKALANQIAVDQETLAALHQTTEDTRVRTNELRQETAAQKRALDASLAGPQGRQGRAQEAREADGRGAGRPEADLPASWPGTRPPPRRSSARRPPSRSGWPRRSTR